MSCPTLAPTGKALRWPRTVGDGLPWALAWLGRLTLGAVLMGLPLLGGGCSRRPHFTVTTPPTPPGELAPAVADRPVVPVVVEIENFRVFDETKYPADERELLRRTFSIQVPNSLFAALARRGAVGRVVRVERRSGAADFVVTGTYDYFDQLGGGPLGRIPYYGAYGTIVRAWVRETIDVAILDARSGVTLWHKSLTNEQRKLGRNWEPQNVEFLRAEFMDRVVDAILDALGKLKKERRRR